MQGLEYFVSTDEEKKYVFKKPKIKKTLESVRNEIDIIKHYLGDFLLDTAVIEDADGWYLQQKYLKSGDINLKQLKDYYSSSLIFLLNKNIEMARKESKMVDMFNITALLKSQICSIDDYNFRGNILLDRSFDEVKIVDVGLLSDGFVRRGKGLVPEKIARKIFRAKLKYCKKILAAMPIKDHFLGTI